MITVCVASLASSKTRYSTVRSPIFFGSSAAVFFCGMPTTAVAPVDEAITPIFNWAAAQVETQRQCHGKPTEGVHDVALLVDQTA